MNRKNKQKGMFAAAVIAIILQPATVIAQNKVEASLGADLVSDYIWRGQHLGNVSIQPSVAVAYKGFSLTGWSSIGFQKDDTKEIDLTLAYKTGGLSVSVTDYWTAGGPGYFHFGARNTAHVFEAQAGYDFNFLAVNWYTNFAGNDGVNSDGKRAYSSYVNISAPFRLGGLEWTAEIGATPWKTTFYNNGANGFEVTDIGIRADKEISITSQFSLPLFVKAIWNPSTEGAYFVAGLTF